MQYNLHLRSYTPKQLILKQAPKITLSNGYNKLTLGYFEPKLHKHILGTPETNIASCKKGHNRCPLSVILSKAYFLNFI